MTYADDYVDIEYEDGSCAGPVSMRIFSSTEKMYGIRYEPAYLTHLQRCNGGKPRKRYFDMPGNTKVITRFLCMIDNLSADPSHKGYDVGVVLSQIFDRLLDSQVPFAELFAGDMLCFDQSGGEAVPRVVVWNHEGSQEGQPSMIPVASNFIEFLKMLRTEP